jgi:hypothetical protein
MTLLHGITEAGEELPVLVDQEGRLVTAPATQLWGLPPGGMPGQIVAKLGEADGDAEWVDDEAATPVARAFGIRSASMVFVPSGTTPQPLLFPGRVELLNGATYDPATGRITPTVPGHWWITAASRVGTAMTAAKLRLRFNSSDVASSTRSAPQGDCPVLLSAQYFGYFNGTTDSILAEVVHGNASSLGYDQSQICGFFLPAP